MTANLDDKEVRVSQDEPPDARPENMVYWPGLVGQRSTVAAFVRRDRRNKIAIVALATAVGVQSFALAKQVTAEKVFVYVAETDPAGQQVSTLVEPVFKTTEAKVLETAKWWIYHLRVRSLDPVADDRLIAAAEVRTTGSAEMAFPEARKLSDLREGEARTIDITRFQVSELSKGEAGMWSWVIQWPEEVWRKGMLRDITWMMATLNIRVGPPSFTNNPADNRDGIWVEFFKIGEVPPPDAGNI